MRTNNKPQPASPNTQSASLISQWQKRIAQFGLFRFFVVKPIRLLTNLINRRSYTGVSTPIITPKRQLGSGVTAIVQSADLSPVMNCSGSTEGVSPTVARKQPHDETLRNDMNKEAAILRRLNHPNIVKVSDIRPDDRVIEVDEDIIHKIDEHDLLEVSGSNEGAVLVNGVFENERAGLLMEIADSSFRGKTIDSLNDQCAVTSKLLSACRYMARMGVIHHDIKPDNILMKGKEPLVTDFGSVQCSGTNSPAPFLDSIDDYICTPNYVAPEFWRCLYNDKLVPGIKGDKCMAWSLGCSLAEMVTGVPVFPNEALFKPGTTFMLSRIKECCYEPTTEHYEGVVNKYFETHKDKFEEPLLKVLRQLLTADPEQRPSLVDTDFAELEQFVQANGSR